MAFIDNQDENQLDPNATKGQAPQVGSGSSLVGSGGGGGGGGSAAGVGPGGTGGWTNIQAYLGANQGDTGSSQLLNKTVGDQFGQERQNFQNDSSNFLQGAQKQVDGNKIDNGQADNYIKQAGDQYSYGGNQNDVYKGITNKFQSALNGQYSGPTQYNYGFNDKTQQYGSDLGDNASFDTLMKGLYSNTAQSPLSSGQYQLQKQFDVNNQALGDTRKSLKDQYTQLGADRDKTVGDTTTALGGLEQTFRDNQSGLKDYLTKQSNNYDTQESQKESDARAGYQKAYKTEGTGRSNALEAAGFQDPKGFYGAYNIWGPNLTAEQLQNEQDFKNKNPDNAEYAGVDNTPNDNPRWQTLKNTFYDNANALQRFYNQQEQNYSQTGDPEKRAYNSIQDFLGTQNAKKPQGFDVGAPWRPSLNNGFRRG